jgi:hypothetical protein
MKIFFFMVKTDCLEPLSPEFRGRYVSTCTVSTNITCLSTINAALGDNCTVKHKHLFFFMLF